MYTSASSTPLPGLLPSQPQSHFLLLVVVVFIAGLSRRCQLHGPSSACAAVRPQPLHGPGWEWAPVQMTVMWPTQGWPQVLSWGRACLGLQGLCGWVSFVCMSPRAPSLSAGSSLIRPPFLIWAPGHSSAAAPGSPCGSVVSCKEAAGTSYCSGEDRSPPSVTWLQELSLVSTRRPKGCETPRSTWNTRRPKTKQPVLACSSGPCWRHHSDSLLLSPRACSCSLSPGQWPEEEKERQRKQENEWQRKSLTSGNTPSTDL